MIEARVNPETVWAAWERAHQLEVGHKGKSTFRYQILDVKKGESFSILWKGLFVRLVFSHAVAKTSKGCQIQYTVQIKGLFAWPVRWFLQEKIKRNIRSVMKAFVAQLENK